MNARRLSILLFAALLAHPGVARAHEGHDHAEEPAAVPLVAAMGDARSARSAEFELLARVLPGEAGAPGALRLLLADDATNEPVADARLQVGIAGRDTAWVARAEAPGVYRVDGALPAAGWVRLEVAIEHGSTLDLLTIDSLRAGPPPAPMAEPTRGRGLAPWQLGGLVVLALGASGALWARRRGGPRRGAAPGLGLVLGLVLVAIGSSTARAHEGALHEPADAAPGGTRGVAGPGTGAVPAGARYVAKEAQFALGLRTAVASEEPVAARRTAAGTVVADASAAADLVAPQTGRFTGRRAFQVGERVARGEALGAVLVVDELPVRAPIGGTLAAVAVVPGQTVAAGQVLARVVDLSRVRVELPLYGDALSAGLAARTATVRVPALPGAAFAARVQGLAPATVGASPAPPLVLSVANTNGLLRPGMVVEVDLATGPPAPAVTVPARAVLATEQGPVVFVKLGPEAFALRAVTLGARVGDRVAVARGVAAGERVVVAGGAPLLSTAEAPR